MSLVLVKTRVRQVMKDDIKRIAERDVQSEADVLRRFIREGIERDKKSELAKAVA